MIALLLAAQMAGTVAASPSVQALAALPPRAGELIRVLPRRAACKGDAAQMEVSFATPAALYRQGDRPAKGLKNWADYPDGQVCAVSAAK